MPTEREGEKGEEAAAGQQQRRGIADRTLGDIVRDADDYYNYLIAKHASKTRLDVVVVSLVVWFAAFAVLGLGSFAIYGEKIQYLVVSFVVAIVIGAAAGVATYATRRRRGFKFAELGILLKKMKDQGGAASSEDGLRLMDAMHQAALVAKKRKMDAAFEYGVVAFIIVALIGMNAATGALAGVVAYLYFRFEALRDYEKEDERYEDSKKELLLSL
jgi:hypothetical protein